MSVYKRGNVYWYEFWFRGHRICQSTGLTNRVAAQQAEAIRKAGLAEGESGNCRAEASGQLRRLCRRNEFLALGREAISVSSKNVPSGIGSSKAAASVLWKTETRSCFRW